MGLLFFFFVFSRLTCFHYPCASQAVNFIADNLPLSHRLHRAVPADRTGFCSIHVRAERFTLKDDPSGAPQRYCMYCHKVGPTVGGRTRSRLCEFNAAARMRLVYIYMRFESAWFRLVTQPFDPGVVLTCTAHVKCTARAPTKRRTTSPSSFRRCVPCALPSTGGGCKILFTSELEERVWFPTPDPDLVSSVRLQI